MAFVIKHEVFEGPLELLLSLIEKRKLLINDISLATVADDFIAYIKQFENFPLAESAHFILIASTLLLIKSKSLLPQLELSEEEQGSIEDLERRLRLYKRMKALSRHIRERFGVSILFLPNARKVEPVFSPDGSMSLANHLQSLKETLKNLPQKENLPKAIVQKVLSLEEMIESLTTRIQEGLKMSFRQFSGHGKQEKINVIVSFLAMLELVKQGIINVTQERRFEDITMETEALDVPKYT